MKNEGWPNSNFQVLKQTEEINSDQFFRKHNIKLSKKLFMKDVKMYFYNISGGWME